MSILGVDLGMDKILRAFGIDLMYGNPGTTPKNRPTPFLLARREAMSRVLIGPGRKTVLHPKIRGKYKAHQGAQECARRVRQMAKGVL